MKSDFYGRIDEIDLLNKLECRKQASIGVIYGRRRVGKSSLIKHAYRNNQTIFFEGLENQSQKNQILNFQEQCTEYVNLEIDSTIKSWRNAFNKLTPFLLKGRKIIVFDEFQWMANYRSSIVSDLKMIWDRHWSKNKQLTLILCGSIASFMTQKVIHSKALYGRTDLIINLREFRLNEVKQMLHKKGLNECLEANLVVGGVPKYLELLNEYSSIHQAINALAFQPSGFLSEEYERIFVSHFSKKTNYQKLIKALSDNSYGLNRKQLSNLTGEKAGGTLSSDLTNLEAAGFIVSYTPIQSKGKTRLIRYILTDSFLRFYYSFILPNYSKIKKAWKGELFLRIATSSKYTSWLGRSFEILCMNHSHIISKILGFNGIEYSVGPFFKRSDQTTSGIQIDLVFDRKDNVLSLCEMKYTRGTINKSIIEEIDKKAEYLENHFPGKTIEKILIVKGKVSKDLINSNYFYRIIYAEELFI